MGTLNDVTSPQNYSVLSVRDHEIRIKAEYNGQDIISNSYGVT